MPARFANLAKEKRILTMTYILGWCLHRISLSDLRLSQLVAYAAKQLNVSPELLHNYSRDRDTTRREHLLELQRDFGFQLSPRRFGRICVRPQRCNSYGCSGDWMEV